MPVPPPALERPPGSPGKAATLVTSGLTTCRLAELSPGCVGKASMAADDGSPLMLEALYGTLCDRDAGGIRVPIHEA